MWNADGFEVTARYADALEADVGSDAAIGAPGPALFDPWMRDVITLQRDLTLLNDTTIFPETQRIER